MRSLASSCAPAHILLGVSLGLAACEAPAVEARAVWIDTAVSEDERRVQIYDRGTREALRVGGQTAPQEYVRLGPRGQGLLLRAGSQAGAWFDLDDGRRLPLRLPGVTLEQDGVRFSADGRALWWLEDEALALVALSPGSARVESESGVAAILRYPGAGVGGFAWGRSSTAAPVLLLRERGETAAASFVRYPVGAGDQQGLGVLARTPALPLPSVAVEQRDCAAVASCRATIALSPNGARAIAAGSDGSFYALEARAGVDSGLLALPPELADNTTLSLMQLLDTRVSVWSGGGQIFRWDERVGRVDALPVFFAPPLHWASAARGHALVLVSATGQMLRVDARGSELLNLETSACGLAGSFAPVLSPGGEYAAWTCTLSGDEVGATQDETSGLGDSGAVLRVSRAGLERFVGVPMRAVAIDDEGGLLLYSVTSERDEAVDGIAASTRPRNLFVLSPDAQLSRVDELEPAPAPVLVEISAPPIYVQGAALD